MSTIMQRIRRFNYGFGAVLFSLAVSVPILLTSSPVMAAEVQTRSITLSSSQPSAANVTYTLTFTPETAGATEIVVDFCSNDPLINDSCTATVGTDVPSTSGTLTLTSGSGTLSTLTDNHGFQITGTTLTAGTAATYAVSGITNPSDVATFYARILTYPTGDAASYTSGNPGTTYVDYGGDALSTANSINITAKVYETLTFCLYTGSSCSTGTAPQLTLGDATTGALSPSNAYVNSNTRYDLATNAGSGVSIVMRGTTLCRAPGNPSCSSGSANSDTITPIGGTTTGGANTTSSVGTEQFGMCANEGGSAAITVSTTYTDATATNCTGLTTGVFSGTSTFGFDNTAVTSASGSQVISSTGAVPSMTGGQIAFLANINATTEAGIYQDTLNFVATSTY